MTRSTTATTSTAALAHNLAVARASAPGARAWAVVKAEAYGHGLGAAMTGFAAADGLALLEFDSAARLREAGWQRPILLIEGAFDEDDVGVAGRLRLTLVVHCEEQVRWLEAHRDEPVATVLKVDTGLNRLGVPRERVAALHERLSSATGVSSVALMSHFANADVAGGAEEAIAAFDAATGRLPGERSLANSAAVLTVPQAHRDWIRPGIMLYGATPFSDRSAADFGLRPAMSLTGRLIGVRELAPGDSVGYGSAFTAPSRMRIGIVDCGYADGYPRIAPTGTPVAVAGVRTRTVGRVSMDMLAVDIDAIPAARPGSPVELWGAQVSVDEVATAAGTIGYELLCAVAPRVRRVVREDFIGPPG